MEIDFDYMADRLHCSYSEKLECLVTLNQIIYVANMARKYGLHAVENEINFDNYPNLLKRGVILLSNSVEYDILKEIVYTYIMCGNYRGKEFLENIMIADGILSIAESLNPRTIQFMLLSYFGEDKYLIEHKLDKINGNRLSKAEIDKLLSEKGE